MEIINRSGIKPFVTKDGSQIFDILSPRNSSVKHQSLAEARLKPGQISEEHFHEKSEEIYYILAGSGLIFLGKDKAALKKGDAIIIESGTKHRIQNTGKEELVFLCCCAPPYSHDDTTLTKQ